jgi:hypothetical protein
MLLAWCANRIRTCDPVITNDGRHTMSGHLLPVQTQAFGVTQNDTPDCSEEIASDKRLPIILTLFD